MLTLDQHTARAAQIEASAKRTITLTDAMKIWGLSKTAARYELQKLVEIGLIEYEQTGENKGRYYLKA